MEIKAYNRAVDPNVENASVQATNNIEAFGGNTTGNQLMGKAVGAIQDQIKAYTDEQIKIDVVDASNKYQEKLNDLLNNPGTGLLTKKDTNALDLMRQYQEGEAKIRQEVTASLPNYEKAHRAFTNMADETNISQFNGVMKYQAARQDEYRKNVYSTRLKQNTDSLVEKGTNANIFEYFSKNQAIVETLYGNVIGEENRKQMIKDANTDMFNLYSESMLADGSQESFTRVTSLLANCSEYINDDAVVNLTNKTQKKKKAIETERDIEGVRKRHPGDVEAQIKDISENNTVISYRYVHGGSGGASNAFEANFMVESGGDYNAVNGSSGAFGRYQFLPSTWEWVCSQTGVNVDDHSTEAQDKNAKWYWDYFIGELGGDEKAACVAWNWGLENGRRWKNGMSTGIYNGREFTWDEEVKGNMSVNNRLKEFDKYRGKAAGGGLIDKGFEYSIAAGLVGIQMPNKSNGCVEFAVRFGASYNQFLADQAHKNQTNCPAFVKEAAEAGIQVIPFAESKLSKGDCIIYHTSEGEDGHVTIYDGNGGYYGNSSSRELTVHGSDYHLDGTYPEKIVKTGEDGTGHYERTETSKRSPEELRAVIEEIRRRDREDRQIKKEKIEAKVKDAKGKYINWGLANPNATDSEKRNKLAELMGDDEDLKNSELGTLTMSIDKGIRDKTEAAAKASSKGNVFDVNNIKARIQKGEFNGENGRQELSFVLQNSPVSFTPEQIDSIYTLHEDVQNGRNFKIQDRLTADMLGMTNEQFSRNKTAMSIIVGEKISRYKSENGGSEPDLTLIKQWAIEATYSFDSGATAEYGVFKDRPLEFSDADIYNLGYAGWERIKTPEGVYIRLYKDGDFKDVYATEFEKMLKNAGLR